VVVVTKITKGNVFEDLGFDPAESADLALRAYLMAEVRKFVEKNGLNQNSAAKFFETSQPKISNIINGKIREISSDYLVGLLAKTGGQLRYSFKQPTKRQIERRLGA
jgi:predicted XRE-type DNA-binding protein